MLRKFDLLKTFNNFFSIDIRQPENEHANVEEEIRQLRTELNDTKRDLANVEEENRKLRSDLELNDTKGDLARVAEERDNLEERCQILAKQLEEAQVVGDSRKQRTSTFQDKATSPRKLEWKGKRRLRINTMLNSMRNQGRKRCFEVQSSLQILAVFILKFSF